MQAFAQSAILFETQNLRLEPIRAGHASSLYRLFWDPKLYDFIPQEPPTPEALAERCARWEKQISPDGRDVWLNWIAYLLDTEEVLGHFQVTLKDDHTALIAYMVSRLQQKKGYAGEGLKSILSFLKDTAHVKTVRALIDTRNFASQRVIAKLGFELQTIIKDADSFKGASSDEWLYELRFP